MSKVVKKILGWTLGVVLAFFVGMFGLQWAASERVEVVEVQAKDPTTGEMVITRLWVVDHDGNAYLRVGSDGSGWYSRLSTNPEIIVTRQGQTQNYLAVSEPDKSEIVNNLMQEKYTWGDTLIGYLVGSREGSIPVRLEPR